MPETKFQIIVALATCLVLGFFIGGMFVTDQTPWVLMVESKPVSEYNSLGQCVEAWEYIDPELMPECVFIN